MNSHLISASKVVEQLHTQIKGLNKKEVEERLEKYGLNKIQTRKPKRFISCFLSQFKGYLVWLLLGIAIFAFGVGIFFGKGEQFIDGIIILGIVLINAMLGAFQEFKSDKAAQLLNKLLKNTALVARNGNKEVVDAEQLVPGDIIFLTQGNKVPADCRIIACDELSVDESQLTGESVAVSKDSAVLEKDVPLAERKNMVYMNTYITRGQATCVVVTTGSQTEIGTISKSLDIEQPSLFLKEVDDASKKITYAAIALIIVALLVYYLKSRSFLSVFFIGAALVIGSIPEGLPAIVTFTLAVGSMRLAKNNVLIKKKAVLETLGSVDVICADKTGTLTQNSMVIKKFYVAGKKITDSNHMDPADFESFKNCAILCNEAKDTDKGFVGDAEDIALINELNKGGVDVFQVRENNPQQSFIPFSSETKYAKSTNTVHQNTISYFKGAPEIILADCKFLLKNGKVVPLTAEERKKIDDVLNQFSEEALRNLAFSYQQEGSSKGNILIALAGLYDPPKENIAETIQSIYDAHIELKMITGDNIKTATAIAKECGFRNVKAIEWTELKDLSSEELKKQVELCNVFARMSPEFKLKIVAALQENGHRIAITGDGVNDVPALKKAEVGIAMGSKGSDIAKEGADIILLDDKLSTIINGIKEGRTIFANIRKVINYLLTANLAEVLVVFISAMFGLVPFVAVQLLWVNFVTDIGPAMALGMDPAHKDILQKKPTGKTEQLINKRITMLTVYISVKKVFVILLVFILSYLVSNNLTFAQTMAFTWLVFSHFVRIFTIRLDEKMDVFVNKYVNWALLIPILLQLIIIYTPLRTFFHVVPLNVTGWVILLVSFGLAIYLAKLVTNGIDRHLDKIHAQEF